MYQNKLYIQTLGRPAVKTTVERPKQLQEGKPKKKQQKEPVIREAKPTDKQERIDVMLKKKMGEKKSKKKPEDDGEKIEKIEKKVKS